jgi:hypothetical protein
MRLASKSLVNIAAGYPHTIALERAYSSCDVMLDGDMLKPDCLPAFDSIFISHLRQIGS